jgi:hypothetical protein
MGLHPFALQNCFRCAAAELLKYPENEMTIFFGRLRLRACDVGCGYVAVLKSVGCEYCDGFGMFVEVAYRTVRSSVAPDKDRYTLLLSSLLCAVCPLACVLTNIHCLTTTGEALESLLLRNDFVDAQVLSAIWPVEFDRYKVSNAQHVLRLARAFYPVVWSVQCAVYPHSVAL